MRVGAIGDINKYLAEGSNAQSGMSNSFLSETREMQRNQVKKSLEADTTRALSGRMLQHKATFKNNVK